MAVAKSTARTYVVTPLDGSAPFLFVEFLIDCPECGVDRIRIAGHHLKMVRDVCLEAIDEHPELVGKDPQLVRETTIVGRSNDPSTS